ncbi:amidohydrolase family protein [Chloroflexota bacterium]
MKIDAYPHFCPKEFIDAFSKRVVSSNKFGGGDQRSLNPMVWDVNLRLEIMDRYEDYAQILTPTGPQVETFCSSEDAVYLAKIFNDAMAELVNKYPDKFVAAVAYLPLNDIDATLKEIDRTINELGFKGILIHTPTLKIKGSIEQGFDYENVRSIDIPEYMPIYESMSKHNLPIWLHPRGLGAVPVYSGEERGKYMLYHIFGWPIESALAMGRLVYGGTLAKYPNLRFIIHHCGSGIVPILGGRIDWAFDFFRCFSKTLNKGQAGAEDLFALKRPIDYFKMFYADTAISGYTAGLMCGHDFFGAEHIIFGTDYPYYDPELGSQSIKKTSDSVNRMNISDADKQKIFEGNIKRILHLP